MEIRKAMGLVAAMIIAAGSAAGAAEAQERIEEPIVRGNGVCGTAGPVGRYTLNWVVINPEANGIITVTSATESGEYEGEVDIEPARLPGGESGRATDGPVPGNTQGTVTLTIAYATPDGRTGRTSGSLVLDGDCRTRDEQDAAKNGPSRVDLRVVDPH